MSGMKDRPFVQDMLRLSGAMRRRISRRQFLKKIGRTAAGMVVLGGGGWAYSSKVEPFWFQLVRVTLTLPRLDPAFNGFKLVQFSDIHLSELITGTQVRQAVETALAQQPDLVAVTGDFVDETYGLHDSVAILINVLRPLAEQVTTVSVLGNHDYHVGAGAVRRVMSESHMIELSNRSITLERGAARLHIAGVDDVAEGHARLSQVLKGLDGDDQAAILLAHEPDFADSAAMSQRFDLQISGHSHGGQVAAPFVGPLILPPYGRKYPSGLYRVGGMLQYTNRGLGTIPPRLRFNCRPEITLFTLKSGRG